MRIANVVAGIVILSMFASCSSGNKTPSIEIVGQDVEPVEDIGSVDGTDDIQIDLHKDLPMVQCKNNVDCEGVFDKLGPCEVTVCDSLAGVCLLVARENGEPCENDDLCTEGEVCKDGDCTGTSVVCDDENGCTTDLCDPLLGCVFEDDDEAQCDDQDACTQDDACLAGQCAGTPASCDDENPCTADSCDPLLGCVSEFEDGAQCDDNDLCTDDDACFEGQCSGTAVQCDDDNVCTADSCNPESGCEFQAVDGEPCDDGNVCTVDDKCFETECASGENQCQCTSDEDCKDVDDADLCNGSLHCIDNECLVDPDSLVVCDTTTDTACVKTTCNPQTGQCVQANVPPGTACDDSDACTFGESCAQGACGGGIPVTCDDDNLCTEDKCTPNQGCIYVPFSGIYCDDGNPCTGPDICLDGECLAGNNSCDCVEDADCFELADGNLCLGSWTCTDSHCQLVPGSQVECTPPDNPCMTANCVPATGECVESPGPNGASCDDVDMCTEQDICVDGLCIGSLSECDDNNLCTDDWCDPLQGCVNDPADLECDDENPCTAGDWCQDGECQPGPENICECTVNDDCTQFNPDNLCAGTWVCIDAVCQLDLDSIPVCDMSADTQCVKNLCNPQTGICEFTDMPDGTQCDDSLLCTENDVCQQGACAGVLLACDDGNLCTDDVCIEPDGCTHLPNNLACDDSNACTMSDACQDGQCSGTPLVCDDDNICTDDWCDPQQGCVADPADVACDDGNACTQDDWCEQGQCGGETVDCSDDNICTDDDCDPVEGCVNYNNESPCDDQDPCTMQDMCAAGECVPGIPIDCSDDNPCTADSCTAGQCVHDPLDGQPCDDGNLCTIDDICSQDLCGGATVNCDDGNLCTDDQCLPETGCTHDFNNAACDDDDPCTGADTCVQGSCKGGPPVVCDDKNVCTVDSCVPLEGCLFEPISGNKCNDADACTTGDMCEKGQCVGSQVVLCDDKEQCTKDSCDPDTGCVFEPLDDTGCDDGNACTDGDSCSLGKCGGTPVVCDDEDACTQNLCNPGTGCLYPAVPDDPAVGCDDANPCSLTDQCVGGQCVGMTFKLCDDKDVCTDDYCDETTGLCATNFNTAPCDDYNPCTEGDACAKGKCLGGGWKVCNDDNICTDDSCQPAQDGCVFEPNSAPCEDGDNCTVGDLCQGGQCTSGNNSCECVENSDCVDDGNPCNGNLICVNNVCETDPDSIIVCDSSADTDCRKATCDPATGECPLVDQPNGTMCDDSSVCTLKDSCTAGQCAGLPIDCSDDNTCTQDLCHPQDGCYHEDVSGKCDDSNPCTVDDLCSGGQCAGSPYDCNDNNPCTNDQCVAVAGQPQCFYQNNTDPCDDDDLCTSDDTCAAGTCVGAAVTCKDDNICTDDSCDPQQGCVFDPNTDPCDDQDLCTISDNCSGGKCVGIPMNCNDNNVCTDDSCSPDTGICQNTPNTAACNDGNACTDKDICAAGVCAGTPIVCDDMNPCTKNQCDKQTGCNYPNEPDGQACNDNDVCTNSDACATGQCVGKPVPGCCNLDSECDDDYSCTADLCVNHACQNGPLDCKDDNPCSADWCDGGDCLHGSLGLEQVLFFEDFDSGASPGWSVSVANGATQNVYWSVDDQRSFSGDYSLYAGNPDTHSYDYGIGNTTAVTPQVPLPADSPARVTFYYHMLRDPTEWADCNYDYLRIAVQPAGGAVTALVPRRCQNTGGFVAASYDLSSYAGQTVRVHFTFATQDALYNKGEGVYLDDVAILSGPAKGCCDVDGDCGDADECTFDLCQDFTCEFPDAAGTYFAQDFEDGSIPTGQWWNPDVWYLSTDNANLAWQVDDNRSYNTPYSLYGGNLAKHNYDQGAGVIQARTPRITVPAGAAPLLTFYLWMQVQQDGCNNDTFDVLASSGLGVPEVMFTQCATTDGFEPVEVDLSKYAGTQFYLTFRFSANNSNNAGEGVYLDHIRVGDKVWDEDCCVADGDCDDDDKCTVDDCVGTPGGGVCSHQAVAGFHENFDDGAADGWNMLSGVWQVNWQVDKYRSVSKPNSLYCGNVNTRTYVGYGAGKATATTPWMQVPNVPGLKAIVSYSRYLSLVANSNHCFVVSLQRQWPNQTVQLEQVCGNQIAQPGWVPAAFPLDAYLGATVRLTFALTFPGGPTPVNPPEGAYLDDFFLGYDGCQ